MLLNSAPLTGSQPFYELLAPGGYIATMDVAISDGTMAPIYLIFVSLLGRLVYIIEVPICMYVP